MLIKGTREIDFSRDGYVYIYQQNFVPVAVQENENGSVSIDVSHLFEKAQKWKWGIKTSHYYGVLLNAIAFKVPQLNLSVSNVLISIKKDKEFIFVNALVFDKDPERAFSFAQQFKKANRSYIAFEVSGELHMHPLRAENVEKLLENIDRNVEEIKRTTQQTFEKTKEVEETNQLILKEIREIKQRIEKLELLQKKENSYNVQVYSRQGVYVNGEKIYLNLLGEVFDYLEVDVNSFITFFGYPSRIIEEIKDKVQTFVKNKYINKEEFITPQEAERITGLQPKNFQNWRIVLSLKNQKLKQLTLLLKQKIKISPNRLETILKTALKEVVKQKKEKITFEDIIAVSNDDEKKEFEKIGEIYKKMFFEGKKDYELKDEAVIVADEKLADLLLYALTLEVEKRTRKQVQIKGA